LHSWFNLLEVAFNCLALLLSPAALFIRSAHSQQGGFDRSVFPCLQVDAAPTVLIGSLEEIETGVRNCVMAFAFD
jgi:hypothetical protein